ncbi:hypothetical protein [Kordiimonas sp.]|uniref:hypothetical protein n=1 Tax=Kordiimonas sp. TaxID=1970157 RepID=UPI003A9019C5
MNYPVIFKFDMGKARLRRAGFYGLPVVLAIILCWAILTGQDRVSIIMTAVILLFSTVFAQFVIHYMVKPCFRAENALEIHADHLVWATANGPHVIPRAAVKCVMGGDRLQWGGVTFRVEVDVTPEYKVKSLYGFRINPELHDEFANRQTEVSVSIALINWFNDGR